jgi:Amt family ammonium transporter
MEKSLLDIVWIIMASGLVFIMQAGFAMVESGLTRSKNSINVAIKNLTDLGISVMVFWACGFALMFGSGISGLIGGTGFFFTPGSTWGAVFFLFQAMFCSTSATIVSGAVAERMKYGAYILSTVFLSLVIYPVFGHWVWAGGLTGTVDGWLGKFGFVDFAGSTVVHSLGGWVSLAAILVIGPRTGRFADDGKVRPINGSSIPMAVLGVILLWFGWIGFNGGSTLAMNGAVPGIIVRTVLAAAAGLVATLALGWPILKRPDVGLVLNGSLAGLVAITASCHAVSEAEAVLIGAAGGVFMFFSSLLMEKLRIDDAVGAIPVHLVAGIWGTLAVALFGDPAILGTGLGFWPQLGAQALGILVCGLWAFGLSWLVLFAGNRIRPLRVSAADEYDGLNVAEHGVTTEILDLYNVLEEQGRTGNLSLRAPEEPFTEAGQIARLYNRVMNRLEGSTIEKGAYLDILNSVSDGLFLVTPDRRIGPRYSAALAELFPGADPAGLELRPFLARFFPEERVSLFNDYLDLCFDGKKTPRALEKLNPFKETEVFLDDGSGGFSTRFYRFSLRRVMKEGRLDSLMVVVRDVTGEKMLAREVEETRERGREEIELLSKILPIEPAMLGDFLSSSRVRLDEINGLLSSSGGGSPLETLVEGIYRNSHALKGDSDLLGLEALASAAHELEEALAPLRGKPELTGEDFFGVALKFGALDTLFTGMELMVDRFHSLAEVSRSNRAAAGTGITLDRYLENLAVKLAEKYGKNVKLEVKSFAGEIPEGRTRSVSREILVQLIRNAVYHGIELPAVRTRNGKAPHGLLSLEKWMDGNRLFIRFRDDGAGIDPVRIRETLVFRGIMTREKADSVSDREICGMIFAPGFSTAGEPDRTAGQGVGMSLVRNLVLSLKGKIHLSTRKGMFSEFLIELPAGG